jgi:hypothetical protein
LDYSCGDEASHKTLESRHQNEGVKKAFRAANHQEGWIWPLQPLLVKDADFTKCEGKPQPDYSSAEPVNNRMGWSRSGRRSLW